MTAWRALRLVLAMAWREARGSRRQFALVVLVMTLAAACAFGVRTVSAGFAGNAFENARGWIAADATAMYFGQAPTPEQWAAVRSLGAGVESTLVAQIATLAYGQGPDPIVIEAKVVDPAAYPYYGRFEGVSGHPLTEILDSDSLIASPDVLATLQVRAGGVLRIHETEFRIRDVIAAEPDSFAIPPSHVGRVIMSPAGAARTDVTRFGARGFYRILLRVASGLDRQAMCRGLEEIFPDARVIDFTSRTLETSVMEAWVLPFLDVIGFLAIAFGAAVIGVVAYFHVRRNLDTVAKLKCLGATNRLIQSVYFTQVFCLTLAGTVAGTVGGHGIAWLVSYVTLRYFDVQLHFPGDSWNIVETALLNLTISGAVVWIPLARVRSVAPWALLRRDTDESAPPVVRAWFEPRRFLASLALLAGFGFVLLLMSRVSGSWRSRAYLLAAVGASSWVVYALAGTAIAILSRLAPKLRLPWAIRTGIANLHRYRHQSRISITVLASGVAFIVIAVAAGARMRAYITDSLPFHAANLLLIHVEESNVAEISRVLAGPEGVETPPQFIPTAWLALSRAGESTLEALRSSTHPQTWIQRDWPASCADAKPSYAKIVTGAWWRPDSPDTGIAVSEDLAKLFRVTAGSPIEFFAGNQPISSHVAAVVRMPGAQRVWWHDIICDCRLFPGAIYQSGAITVGANRRAAVRQLLRERFPDLILLDINDLLDRIEQIGRRALVILKTIALLTICMAACVLLALIRSERVPREHEIAVLRALGAQESRVLGAWAAEHLALGGLAGLFGAILGSVATGLVLRATVAVSDWTFVPPAILAATAGTAVFAAMVGLGAARPLFRRKPMELLHHQ